MGMKYSQIVLAHYEQDKPLDQIAMSVSERTAWAVINKLEGLGGFDHWWDAVHEADEQDSVFEAIAKEIEKVLDKEVWRK